MSALQITAPTEEVTTYRNSSKVTSPYAQNMNALPARFEARLSALLAEVNLPTPDEKARASFLASSVMELARKPQNQADLDRQVTSIGRFLELPAVPLLELAATRPEMPVGTAYQTPDDIAAIASVKIIPAKCANLITIIANSAPTNTRERIFGKDFRNFSAHDLNALYGAASNQKEKNSVLQMACGIAYAQALSGLWAEARPAIANLPAIKNPDIVVNIPSRAPARVSPPLTIKRLATPNNPLATLQGSLSAQEHDALSGLATILNHNRELVPTAGRSMECWQTWPTTRPSTPPNRTCYELQVHPDAADLVIAMAKTLKNNPDVLPQLNHLNHSLREVNPAQPYYMPQQPRKHRPSAEQFCYL